MKTGFDKWLETRMLEASFASAYEEASFDLSRIPDGTQVVVDGTRKGVVTGTCTPAMSQSMYLIEIEGRTLAVAPSRVAT